MSAAPTTMLECDCELEDYAGVWVDHFIEECSRFGCVGGGVCAAGRFWIRRGNSGTRRASLLYSASLVEEGQSGCVFLASFFFSALDFHEHCYVIVGVGVLVLRDIIVIALHHMYKFREVMVDALLLTSSVP